MSVEAEILPPEVSAIAIIDEALSNPEPTLLNPEKRALFLAKVREVSTIADPDVSTSKGRDEIRSMAAKVTKAKSALDKSRLSLTEDYRKKVAQINEAGNQLINSLGVIAKEVRAPLTAWEAAEKEREDKVAEIIAGLKTASIVTIADTSATVRKRGREVFEIEITKEFFGNKFAEAVALKETAVATLKSALDRLIEQEDQAAELQRLREEKEAREAEERREREAREAEERRAAEARAAQEREAQIAREAEERAAQAEREAAQREIDAANERAAKAEREAQAERDRIAAEKAEEERAAEAQRAEQARREKNAAHRREVMGQIKADLIVAAGITEEQATAAVKALVKGTVRHVQVNF